MCFVLFSSESDSLTFSIHVNQITGSVLWSKQHIHVPSFKHGFNFGDFVYILANACYIAV